VSLILQSCIGGVAFDFKVIWLKDWCFKFSVSCKNVDLMIYHLRKFSSKHFNIHFTLWRNGGPDWICELSQWEMLQEAEWHLVSRTKRSYADAVKIKPQSAIMQKRERKKVFKRISYPPNYF
jgi:hypothetical protein